MIHVNFQNFKKNVDISGIKKLAAGLIVSAINDYQGKGIESVARELYKRKALIWIKDNNTNPFIFSSVKRV